jgi:hypothetical protein
MELSWRVSNVVANIGVEAHPTKIRRTVWTKEVIHKGSRGGMWVKMICRDDP